MNHVNLPPPLKTLEKKDKFRFSDSLERLHRNFDRVGREYLPKVKRPSFLSYNLSTDGILSPGNGTHEIERIVKDRASSPYLIGIEIEIERGIDTEERKEKLSEILKEFLPNRHICVFDGSLRNGGVEIVTSPLTPKEVNRIGWYHLLRQLDRIGCQAHDTKRCGLHISISRSFLSDDSWRKLRSFLTKNRSFFEVLSRRNTGMEESADPFHYCRFTNETRKYTALNLSKNRVGEFRFFRGTLKPSSFLASLEIVRALVEYAKGIEGTSKRFTPKGFLKVLETFPMGIKYSKRHLSLLLAERERVSRGPRVRRSEEERRSEVLRSISSGNLYTEGNEVVFQASQYSFGYMNRPIEHNERETFSLPIDWTRSTVPQSLRREIERGFAPSSVTVRSWFTPSVPSSLVLDYRRGGWGRRSWYSYRIERNVNN